MSVSRQTTDPGAVSESGPGLRRGALGALAIFFFVVAAAAPLGATVGNAPLAILLGTGAGVPGAYLIAGIILVLFAIGFARMSHYVQSGGAFYVYISRGLGRTAGAAAAFMAVIVYIGMVVGVGAATGYFFHIVFDSQLGIDLPWQAWAAIALAVVAVLGYLEVALGARVLAIALTCEMAILLVFDIMVLVKGGAHGISGQSFVPSTVFQGSFGVALVFAFASFLGFESAAIYSSEARGGHRSVRRALLGAIVFIAFFYAFSTWCLVNAFGVDGVVKAAAQGPGELVFTGYSLFTGTVLTTIVQFLMISSSLASLLALHNVCSRYLFSLAHEQLLPAWFGRSHPRFRSPHTASIATTVATVVVLAAYAAAGADPLLTIVSTIFGMATLGIILLQAATSVSVVTYFSRRRREKGLTSTVAVSAVAAACLIAAAVLVILNYDTLAGSHGLLDLLPVLLAVAAAVGVAAQWLHRRRALQSTGP